MLERLLILIILSVLEMLLRWMLMRGMLLHWRLLGVIMVLIGGGMELLLLSELR